MPEGVALARDLVSPAIEAAIGRLTPDVRVVAAYHFGFADAEGNPTGGGSGKALRPALALLSARATGAPPERGVTAAVAVELVHNWSLLHDDIMDGDTERRHRPTAWTVFGVGAAILAGDALLALAQDLLLEDGTPQGPWAARCLSAAVQRLISGQGADLAFEKRDDVTLAECLEMAGDKTAALMACACSIGAVHLGAPPTLAMALAGFGAHVGLAFQLTDDLLGIWGAPEVTGKPVRADLRARKKSLPVVAALTSGTPEAADLHALLTDPQPLSEDDLIRAADLVVAAGGKQWAEAEADAAAGRGQRQPGRHRPARRRPRRADRDRRVHHGPPVVADPAVLDLARDTLNRARDHVLGLQHAQGWWQGELETNVTMDAEDLLLREFLGLHDDETIAAAARWIRSPAAGRRHLGQLLRRAR